jgi:hypothetical protein
MRQLDQNAAVSEHEIELSHQSRRRFGQRLLVGLPLLGAALAAQQTGVAEAGTATSPWTMEGNSNVDSNDAIGSKNNIALRFITNNSERLRIAANGNIGAGIANPTARMQIVSGQQVAFRAETSSTAKGVRAVLGVLTAQSLSTDAAAVKGVVESVAQTFFESYGVWGEHRDYGVGVYGKAISGGIGVKGEGSFSGVSGVGETGVGGSGLIGVSGEGYYGVEGTTTEADGIGVAGYARVTVPDKTAVAVLGEATGNNVAGRFKGKVEVLGTLSKSAGSFKIDHPLDPQNKYLSHSFVESPDMMNVYNGNVVLDAKGEATVTLPSYFEALNRDFRYQLTPIGAHAPLYIAQKVRGNTFKIAGGTLGLEVSWQITGIRQDAYAKANPIVVEEDKLAEERGSYLQPEAHGQPAEKGIMQARAQRIEQARAARPQTKP